MSTERDLIRIKTHPGEILKQEFLAPVGLSARALATAINVPANRVTGIVNGTRSVTADTAIRLGQYFKTTPELWMNLQQAHDLSKVLASRSAETEKPARRRGARSSATV